MTRATSVIAEEKGRVILTRLVPATLARMKAACLLLPLLLLVKQTCAEASQLVTSINAAQTSASGGGDSGTPVMSHDGRYVLFSSYANNLVTNANGLVFPPLFPAKLNVFLRDRLNGTTILVSVNTNGDGGGNGDSTAVDISTNGQFALFESTANNLVAGDTNNLGDVFVRDIVNGDTILVSIGSNGGSANGVSRNSVMTPDGRFVAFVSAASNLVSGDLNGIPDVFVRDLVAGTTTLASVGAVSTNNLSPASSSESPGITSDGRYVVFFSTATNLLAGVATAGEIYVRDLVAGTTIQASINGRAIIRSLFGATNAISYGQIISDDGGFVAYEASVIPNQVTGSSAHRVGAVLRYGLSSGLTDIVSTNAVGANYGFEADFHDLDMTPDGRFIAFVTNINISTFLDAVSVWDAQSGIATLASGDVTNGIPTNSDCYWPLLSADGRYVAFFSCATNLVAILSSTNYHLYVHDMLSNTTVLAGSRPDRSVSTFTPPSASLSTNGQFIAFGSFDPHLAADDLNRSHDVFVRNVASGATELISVGLPALPSQSPDGPSGFSASSVSTNARYVAFYSDADNLVANDTNGIRDVFVRDLLIGTNILASADTNGVAPGNGPSTDAAISPDGRYVIFSSSASNLVALADTNNAQDVFVRDLQLGATTLVSVNTNGAGSGTAASYSPIMSSDGRYVLFRSVAANLAPIAFSGYENLFWRDLQAGTNQVLTANSSTATTYAASMTPDGHNVAFGGSNVKLYIWNSQSGNFTYTNSATISAVSISPSGTRLAYISNSASAQLYVADLVSNSNLTLGSCSNLSRTGLQFSGDGRYLAYAVLDSNKISQIDLYDFQTQSNLLVSKAYASFSGGNSNSDSPVVSIDGRFVAYRSFANNIVPNDTNGVPDVFLFDRTTGDTTLVSSSHFGSTSAIARSLRPVFSGDGQTLLFQSWAADIVAQDFNQQSDLFALSLYSANSSSPFPIGILQPATLGQGPTITWLAVPGVSYQVQFKNDLSDPNWQIANGSVAVVGNQGFAADLAPSTTRRFYRVMAH